MGIETRTFDVTGLHEKKYTFKRAQLPLLPGHLSSVYRAQVIIQRHRCVLFAKIPYMIYCFPLYNFNTSVALYFPLQSDLLSFSRPFFLSLSPCPVSREKQ